MKTVVHILNTGTFSGAEKVVITIIKSIKAQYQEDCRYIYMGLKGNIQNCLMDENIEYYLVDKLSIKSIHQMTRIFRPDIIHAHDFTASILSSLFSRNTVVLSHLHNNPLMIQTWNIKSLIYFLTLWRYKKVIAVSNSVIDEFVYSKSISKKAVILGNPVNVTEIRAMAGVSNIISIDIAFLGRLSEQKDPLRFIEIVHKLTKWNPDLHAVMIGAGELKDKCLEKIKLYNLDGNIRLTGFLDNPFPLLKASRLLCITSKWEGFGLMAVEGLACGVPIVSTKVGGLKNLIDDKSGTFCDTEDEFITEIKKLLENEDYYMKKKAGALQRSDELDNIRDYTETIHNIYKIYMHSL